MTDEEISTRKERRVFSSKEIIVLNSLYAGEMNFSEAVEQLGVSDDELEEMLEFFDWVPSPARMQELCEKEKETLSCIGVKNYTEEK